MSARDDGGPAFPTEAAPVHKADHVRLRDAMGWSHEQTRRFMCAHPGMTLRDYFAAAALQGVLASSKWPHSIGGFPSHVSMLAMEIADAMLAARAEGRSDDK